jgi:hypothetical protein
MANGGRANTTSVVAGVIRCSDTGRAALVAVVVFPEQRRSPGSPTPTPDPPNTLFRPTTQPQVNSSRDRDRLRRLSRDRPPPALQAPGNASGTPGSTASDASFTCRTAALAIASTPSLMLFVAPAPIDGSGASRRRPSNRGLTRPIARSGAARKPQWRTDHPICNCPRTPGRWATHRCRSLRLRPGGRP